MKTKLCIYSQPNYLLFRTVIGSGSGALKSAVLHQKPYILVPFSSQSFAYAKLSRLKPPPSMAGAGIRRARFT
ncbi:hypothetical protein DYQ05_00440 [Treponema pedis]|nr:hypothetical protein DYQ05_00440 [Treponema pedis]